MRRIALTLVTAAVAALTLSGCGTSPQAKCEAAVRDYLEGALKAPSLDAYPDPDPAKIKACEGLTDAEGLALAGKLFAEYLPALMGKALAEGFSDLAKEYSEYDDTLTF